MDRKDFLQQTALATLGMMFGPTILSSCRSQYPLIEDTTFDGNVLIIGAGVAGLYAGHMLKQNGIDFKILEASDRYGGRMGKREDFADFPIDLGAEWLHGQKSLMGDLVKKNNVRITRDDSESFFWFKKEMLDELPNRLISLDDLVRGLPDVSFSEYAKAKGFGDEYKFVVEQMAGDLGADSSEISVKWTYKEGRKWSSGDDDFKFERTYFDLVNDYIATNVKTNIHLNTIVESIDYQSDKVKVKDKSGNSYEADKLIITVPITILQDKAITFNPPLSKRKTEAFDKIGMGPGMKVFLKFNEKFYNENIAGGSICAAYADDRIGKTGKDHVLLAFVMGKQAEYLTSLGSDIAITRALLKELDQMYKGKATASFIDSHVENWTLNPFVKGAYSFSKVGIGNAREIAAEPVAGKLFFAGEAMNLNGHYATVHGAAETSWLAVREILGQKKKE